MKNILNTKTKGGSFWISALTGILSAILTTIIIAMLGAFMISEGMLGEKSYRVLSVVCWFASAFIGMLIACKKNKEQHLTVSAVTALGYLLVLVSIQILFFYSQFNQIWIGILVIMVAVIPVLWICNLSKGHKKGKVKYRYI